jgi:aspartate aminotransferase-like enzyme
MALIAHTLGRAFSVYETEDDQLPEPATVARLLQEDPAITHVGLIHCETSTGILNPLSEIAAIVHAAGRKLIVDAMSSFGTGYRCRPAACRSGDCQQQQMPGRRARHGLCHHAA